MVKIKFKTGNAAFGEGDADRRVEIARILREITYNVLSEIEDEGPIMDINGNKVGDWSIK